MAAATEALPPDVEFRGEGDSQFDTLSAGQPRHSPARQRFSRKTSIGGVRLFVENDAGVGAANADFFHLIAVHPHRC